MNIFSFYVYYLCTQDHHCRNIRIYRYSILDMHMNLQNVSISIHIYMTRIETVDMLQLDLFFCHTQLYKKRQSIIIFNKYVELLSVSCRLSPMITSNSNGLRQTVMVFDTLKVCVQSPKVDAWRDTPKSTVLQNNAQKFDGLPANTLWF